MLKINEKMCEQILMGAVLVLIAYCVYVNMARMGSSMDGRHPGEQGYDERRLSGEYGQMVVDIAKQCEKGVYRDSTMSPEDVQKTCYNIGVADGREQKRMGSQERTSFVDATGTEVGHMIMNSLDLRDNVHRDEVSIQYDYELASGPQDKVNNIKHKIENGEATCTLHTGDSSEILYPVGGSGGQPAIEDVQVASKPERLVGIEAQEVADAFSSDNEASDRNKLIGMSGGLMPADDGLSQGLSLGKQGFKRKKLGRGFQQNNRYQNRFQNRF